MARRIVLATPLREEEARVLKRQFSGSTTPVPGGKTFIHVTDHDRELILAVARRRGTKVVIDEEMHG